MVRAPRALLLTSFAAELLALGSFHLPMVYESSLQLPGDC
jgi:hypothetical protein